MKSLQVRGDFVKRAPEREIVRIKTTCCGPTDDNNSPRRSLIARTRVIYVCVCISTLAARILLRKFFFSKKLTHVRTYTRVVSVRRWDSGTRTYGPFARFANIKYLSRVVPIRLLTGDGSGEKTICFKLATNTHVSCMAKIRNARWPIFRNVY